MSKAVLSIEKVGPAEKFGTYHYAPISPDIKKNIRWHRVEYRLIEEESGKRSIVFSLGLIYKMREDGKAIFQSIVDELIKEEGDFEGFVVLDNGKHKLASKTKEMQGKLREKVDEHNRKVCGTYMTRYNLQDILSSIGVTKEMWEDKNHKTKPWLIQWFKLSTGLYNKLYRNDDYDVFFMGLSNDAELWYEEKENQHYAYFQVEDMDLEYKKWDELLDLDEYVEVRITDRDENPLKDNDGNWIRECTPGDMMLHLIVDYGAGDSILNDLVEHIEKGED